MDKRYNDRAVLIDIVNGFVESGQAFSLDDLKYAFVMRAGRFLSRQYLVSLLKELEQMGVVTLSWEYKPINPFMESGEKE